MKFGFIEVQKAFFPVALLCQVLQVSRSGFYAWSQRAESERARNNRELTQEIRAVHDKSRGTYGSPRVHAELRAQGQRVSRKRVARLMRDKGLAARRRRAFRTTTTDSRHGLPIAPNLLGRDFTSDRPDAVWVSDITYIWTQQGWLYLAVMLDLFSRMVVGWAMSDRIDTKLTVDALQMALRSRKPGKGLIHHSDRGSQYASREYQKLLEANGIKCSMSRKGDCWDNAVAESFFASLKAEQVDERNYASREEGRTDVFEYIEGFYNRTRRHSYLGYVSPMEFERLNTLT